MMSPSTTIQSIQNPYMKKRKRPELKEENASTTTSTSAKKTTTTASSSLMETKTPITSCQLAAGFSSSSSSSSSANNRNDASALIISASDKAGMDGIDRCRIDAIILGESGDSLYMQQQRKRDDKVNHRIEQLQQRWRDYQQQQQDQSGKLAAVVTTNTAEIDELLEMYQRQSPTRSTFVVIDMDMFYMAVELLTRPHLRELPCCVGRGMILTSNYVARRYGVRSAMPGFIGDKLVEELSGGTQKLIHLPSNFDLYKEKARIVKDVLREYDPYTIKSYSLDEAYLDIGPYLAIFLQNPNWTHEQVRDHLLSSNEHNKNNNKSLASSAMQFLQSHSSLTCMEAANRIVAELRRRVQQATGGLTCSAGVAPNVSLAKIASDKNKPDGQLLVDPSRVLEFVHSLPIRKIPGIGRVTEKVLHEVCQVHTVKDLYEQRALVRWLFQPSTAEFLLKASVGCNGSGSITSSDFGMEEEESTASSSTADHQKGISRERTFSPESNWSQLSIRLEDIARKVATDMTKKSVMARTVTVKVKLISFDVMSRSQSLKRYMHDPEQLVNIANQLCAHIRAQHKKEHSNDGTRFSVRLLGVRCSNLISESLFDSSERGSIDKFLSSSSSSIKGNETSNPSSDLESATKMSNINRYVRQQQCHSINRAHSSTRMAPRTARNDIVSNNHIERYSTKRTLNMGAPLEVLEDNGAGITSAGTTVPPGLDTTLPLDKQESISALDARDEFVQCPLCHRQFHGNNNAGLNAHIDTCLNGSTVRQAIQEEDAQSGKKPKRLMTDFWSSTRC